MRTAVKVSEEITRISARARKASQARAAMNGSKCFFVPDEQSLIVVYSPVKKHPTPGWTITTYERKLVHLQDYLEQQGYLVVVEEVDNARASLYLYFRLIVLTNCNSNMSNSIFKTN